MTHPLVNIAKCYARLREFRTTETYTDVLIKCDDVEFPCHKVVLAAASDYFHALLGGNFKESTKEIVELQQVSSVAFEAVLRFAYTGESAITANNVYSVLSASELLLMDDLRDQCVAFVMLHNTSLQNALELFGFACATKKGTLVKELSGFIIRHLEVLYKTSEFLDVPCEDLRLLLSRWSTSPSSSTFCDEKVLVAAVVQWARHSRPERLRYFNECIETLPAATRTKIEKYVAEHDPTSLTRFVETGDEFSDLQNAFGVSNSDTSLHVFVGHHRTMSMVTYLINSACECSLLSETPLPYSAQIIKSVVLNDSSLYCLDYCFCNNLDNEYMTWVRPSFRVFTAENGPVGFDLETLPLAYSVVEMCGLQNSIYLYDKVPSEKHHEILMNYWPNSNTLNEEEIRRGIYVYNCEVDNWFSVPNVSKPVTYASMTSCDNNLYLIGGDASGPHYEFANFSYYDVGPDDSRRYAQAYDHRTRAWRELPQCNYAHVWGRDYVTGQEYTSKCCTLNGKIYVLHSDGKGAEVYDPVAGKWEIIQPLNQPRSEIVVPYANRLWAFGVESPQLQVYEPQSNKWYVSPLIEEVAGKLYGAENLNGMGRMMGAVVCKERFLRLN